MNDQERATLEAWVEKLTAVLDLTEVPFEIDTVLDLAGDAARSVVRPAAPVTTFLVGYAAGRAVGAGADPAQALREATGTAVSAAAE